MHVGSESLKAHSQNDLWAVVSVSAVAVSVLFISNPSLFLVISLVALLITALLRFEFFVYATILLMPWYPLVDIGVPLHDVFLLLRFVLLAGTWFRLLREGRSVAEWLFGDKLKKTIMLFAGFAAVSILLSGVPFNVDSVRALARLYSYLAVFFSFEAWLQERSQIATAIKLLLISTIAVDVFGFYQALSGGYTDVYFSLYPTQEEALAPWEGRITSFLFHYNALAGYLNLVFPFAIASAMLGENRTLKMLGVVCACLTVPALFLTQSRGGLVALACVLVLAIWLIPRRFITRIKFLTAVVLLGALLVPTALEHFSRLQEIDDATSLTRIALWQAAVVMFVAHPIFGVGYGNYRFLYDAYVPGAVPGKADAHSLYLQLLAEMGLTGFAVFAGIILAYLYGLRRIVRGPDILLRIAAIGVCGAIVSLLIHGFVDFLFIVFPQFGGMFWLVLAFGQATRKLTVSTTIPNGA